MVEPTREQLLALMHANERQLCESKDAPAAQCEAIFDFYRNQWKKNHSDLGSSAEQPPEAAFDLSKFDPSTLDLSHLHKGERNRILNRQFDARELALLLSRQNPWTKSGKPKPLPRKYEPPELPDDKSSKPDKPRKPTLEGLRQFVEEHNRKKREQRAAGAAQTKRSRTKAEAPTETGQGVTQKIALVAGILLDGVLAVIGSLIPNPLASFAILVLTCVVQLFLLWQLHLFSKYKRAGTFAVWLGILVILTVLWWSARPAPQSAPLTRTDLQEELQTLKPTPSPSPTATPPVATPSPIPSPAAARRQKKSAPKSPRCSAEDRLLGRC